MKNRIFIVCFVFICLTVVTSWLLLRQYIRLDNKNLKEDFNYQTENYIFALTERYARNKVLLESIESFFESSTEVTFPEWNQYIQNLNIKKSFPAINWIAYVKLVPNAQKENFIQYIKNSSVPNFRIWPLKNHPDYAPIIYISPLTYKTLVGFDLYSNSDIRRILQRDISRNELFMTPYIEIEARKSKNAERVLFNPIFTPNNKLTGWIAASINFGVILEQTEQRIVSSVLEIEVYNGKSTALEDLIFQKIAPSEKKDLFTKTVILDFADSEWTIVFKYPDLNQGSITSYVFYLTLILFLLILAFSFFIYFYYFKRSLRTQGICINCIEKSIVKSSPCAMLTANLRGIITSFNPAAEKLLGYSAEEMIGKNTPEILRDPEEIKALIQEVSTSMKKEIKSGVEAFLAITEKSKNENKKCTYIRKDKSKVTVQQSLSILKQESGEIIGVMMILVESSIISS